MPGCEGVECRCCLQGSSSANFPMSEYDISQVQKPATLDMFIVVKLKEAPAMDRAHQKKEAPLLYALQSTQHLFECIVLGPSCVAMCLSS